MKIEAKPTLEDVATLASTLVYSATRGNNSVLFPEVLRLYAPPGSTIADVTFGKGVFWRNVDTSIYQLWPTDITGGVDCRNLPYADSTLDIVVLDPPYMHSPGGNAHKKHQNYEEYYKNNVAQGYEHVKYHDAVLLLYFDAISEAFRVLKPRGRILIKCQDQVCATHFRPTCAEIVHHVVKGGWYMEDIFVLMSTNKPGISRLHTQRHSRRNHSNLIVASKRTLPLPRLACRLDTPQDTPTRGKDLLNAQE